MQTIPGMAWKKPGHQCLGSNFCQNAATQMIIIFGLAKLPDTARVLELTNLCAECQDLRPR